MTGRVLPVRGDSGEAGGLWRGGPVSPAAECVLGPNPSAWTLEGTNTWLIADPDGRRAIVVDPGPEEPGHLAAITAAARARDLTVTGIVLTHGHLDHSAGARTLAAALSVPVRAVDPEHRLGAEGLTDGDVVAFGTAAVRVLVTPGHSQDSVCLLVDHDRSVITGDTVLGRGTSVIAWPDGDLGAYLDSLDRLAQAIAERAVARLLPGHGPAIAEPARAVAAYVEHRRERLDQVRSLVVDGVDDPHAIVQVVYAQVPRSVWPAAELTVRAQLAYLDRRGELPGRSLSTPGRAGRNAPEAGA